MRALTQTYLGSMIRKNVVRVLELLENFARAVARCEITKEREGRTDDIFVLVPVLEVGKNSQENQIHNCEVVGHA